MRKYLFLLLLLLASCASYKEYPGSTFLWEVNSETAKVYIFGSIHMGVEDMYPLPQVVMQSFDQSDFLVMETNIKNLDLENMMELLDFNPENSIEDYFTPENYSYLKDKFEEIGIPSNMLGMFRPSIAVFMLELSSYEKTGLSDTLGIESHFSSISDEKQILSLEEFDSYFKLFDVLDSHANTLLNVYKQEIEQSDSMSITMVDAWKNGDVNAMNEFISEPYNSFEGTDKIYELLISGRNIKMTVKIEEYLETEATYFIVVGAGHLVGEDSIIRLLHDTGNYRIMRY